MAITLKRPKNIIGTALTLHSKAGFFGIDRKNLIHKHDENKRINQ
jgi:hypothetical protein